MTGKEIIEIVQAGSVPIACIFAVLVLVTVIIIRQQNRKFYSIPVKSTTGRLIKSTDYAADTTAEYAEQRQASTVGRYEYYIDGKRHTREVQTSHGGTLKDEITVYYRKGNSDAGLDPNVTSSMGRNLFLVFHFAIICPALAGAIWVLLKLVLSK